MAFIGNKILLGYEDEPVSDKYCGIVDFKTNKIGGKPNWMFDVPNEVKCRLCGLSSALILQIYAPMSNSPYHRTLYIFACLNSICWNKNESWVCLRSQKLDAQNSEQNVEERSKVVSEPPSSWCSGSDAWGDDDSGCHLDYLNEFTQNTSDFTGLSQHVSDLNRGTGFSQHVSDLNRGMSEMSVEEKASNQELSLKERNLNTAPPAFAMIEGGEGDMVCVDTPTIPRNDISALLLQNASFPVMSESGLEVCSFFIAVDEEDLTRVGLSEEDSILSKIREYRAAQENQGDMMTSSGAAENYEKSLPSHGDKMFHRFLTRIHANPGHIIRYGGYPLWLYAAEHSHFRCHYCGGESAFEIQILPTLIPKLFVNGSSGHLEFGSVFVFSCLAGCWDPRQQQLRFENIVVQKEQM